MRLRVYAVFDNGVQAFLAPLFFRAEGEALRAFQTAVADPQSNFGRFKGDYSIFHLGYYDDATGQFVNLQAPTLLANALSVGSPGEPAPDGE